MCDNYVADVEVDGERVELALWDSAGQECYDRLSALRYPGSHVILMCFAVDSPDSLDNVGEMVRFSHIYSCFPFLHPCRIVDSTGNALLCWGSYSPSWLQERSAT